VHFREGRMACVDCHDAGEMHGQPDTCEACHTSPESEMDVIPVSHRYEGLQSPRCETCHVSVTTGTDSIEQHQVHGGELSCQVCHSIIYKNCESCHVQLNESGLPYFTTDESFMGFFIGLNPRRSYDRPYTYVTLRHVPISETSFQFYGEDLLSNFSQLPTWRYATPHNIQLETPQNESCAACHNNPELYLTVDKVSSEEREANQTVIMPGLPPRIDESKEGDGP
jgi:thiosulfate/3-mercaptopyruvate sulfurtransferase